MEGGCYDTSQISMFNILKEPEINIFAENPKHTGPQGIFKKGKKSLRYIQRVI